MQIKIFSRAIYLYWPVQLKMDYQHEGYVLVFKRPWYIVPGTSNTIGDSCPVEGYDDLPF